MKVSIFAVCIVAFLTSPLFGQVSDFAFTNFKKADSIAALYPNNSLKNLYTLSFKLTNALSADEEKFRAIYRWVCNNIDNDYSLFKRNQRKRSKLKDAEALKDWNNKMTSLVFKNLLEKRKTVCTGYAYLIRELAAHAGLTAVIVDGYGRTIQSNIGGTGVVNHSWNAIRLNNKWYLCDATWSSGAIDVDRLTFIKKYDDAYFLADPALFIRNHYPIDSSWMLLREKPTLQQFLNGPVTYTTIYQYDIREMHPETFNVTTTKGEKFTFRFTRGVEEEINTVELNFKVGGSAGSVSPEIYQDASGFYCVDHTFTRKGSYIVHVLLNGRFAFTHLVKVR